MRVVPTSSRPRRVLLTGATGFVGRAVYPALVAAGHDVMRASRQPERAAREHGGGPWVRYEATDAGLVARALQGVDVVLYLVHGMAEGHDYPQRERAAAFALRDAAKAQDLERVIYLGGVEPRATPSTHLASRLETGRLLREGTVPAYELRAGMIVGAGSQSWQICRDLAMRLPLMVLPRWMQSRSQPIAIDDVVTALVAAVDHDTEGHQLFDIPGPDTLSAAEILFAIAQARDMRPVTLRIPLLSPSLSSHWLRLVSGADITVARELVEGLTSDLIATQPNFFETIGHRPLRFGEAVQRALADDHPPWKVSVLENAIKRIARSAS